MSLHSLISYDFARICSYLPSRDVARLVRCNRATHSLIAPLMEVQTAVNVEKYESFDAIYETYTMPRIGHIVGMTIKIRHDGTRMIWTSIHKYIFAHPPRVSYYDMMRVITARDSWIEYDYDQYRLYAKCTDGMTSSCVRTTADNLNEAGYVFQLTGPMKIAEVFDLAIRYRTQFGAYGEYLIMCNPRISMKWRWTYWKNRKALKKYLREHLH